MDFILASLQNDWEALLGFAPKLIYAAVLLTAFLILARVIGRSVGKLLGSSRFAASRHVLQRLASVIVASIGALLALSVLGLTGIAASLVATGGVVAIVLGFAFREIGENFLAGFFLTFSRPFELGDLIRTGDLTGTVRAIEIRSVHIRTFDACDVYVPSAQIFREPLYNYTRDGLRRPAFTVGVAFHDEPQQVIDLLEKAALEVSDVLEDPKPFVTINEFAAQYVEYKVYFWLDVNKSKLGFISTQNAVKVACWHALRSAGMTFSTDVTTGIAIASAPDFKTTVRPAQPVTSAVTLAGDDT